ncbi:MAG: TIGR01777 family oxidoreductase [Candidatus Dormibacteraceae bacterium]
MAQHGTVAILGGSGYVGRPLTAALLAEGRQVRVLTRDVARAAVPAGATAVPWSADGGAGALGKALAGCSAVVNLAGASIGKGAWTTSRREVLLQSRLRATELVVAALAALGEGERPAALVNASGIDYYGDRGDDAVTEKDCPGDSFLATLCRDWESAAVEAEGLGTRVVRLRTGAALAGDAEVLAQLVRPFRMFAGGRLGSGRQWFAWIHLVDLVGLYRLAIADATLTGPVNAVAPDPRRESEVAALIGGLLHRPAMVPMPAFALRLALGRKADLVLHGRRALPEVALAHGYEFRYSTLEAALGEALA